MSESIYHDKDGGTPPAGTAPAHGQEDIARAAEALKQQEGRDHAEKGYGRITHAFSGPMGNPGRFDQGKSTGGTEGAAEDKASWGRPEPACARVLANRPDLRYGSWWQ